MSSSAYHLDRPESHVSAVVFASPHSGREYPAAFLRRSVLDAVAIRSSEDAFVDQLFDCAPGFGAPLLRALAPRAYVDLNRATEEMDPALVQGVRRGGHNPRVASGLGVVPRVVAGGQAIYRGKLTRTEAEARLVQVWHPYHACLQSLLTEAETRFAVAILVDCHSMPHEAVANVAPRGMPSPEVVIGDRFGASASADIVDRIEQAFVAQGFRVARNAPFAGAFITQHYGRPSRRQHAVQIELDRSLYMDEETIRPNAAFQDVRGRLRGVVAEIAAIGMAEQRLAAE